MNGPRFCDCWSRLGLELFVYLYDEDPQLVSNWLQALNEYELYKIHAIADPAIMPIAR